MRVALLFLFAGIVWGNPIDKLLAPYYRANGVVPRAPVSDALFARRVYLDLWGLPPTPEQTAAFQADTRPDKRALLVRELLANRRNYADHWMSFWNDLLRNDEGVVYHGSRESISEWLYGALERNLPYDAFTRALLNPSAKEDPRGFLVGVNWRGDVSASQIPAMQAAQNSAQVFLGVNLKCNSCHDSFISKWKLNDAYGLASFFSEEPLAVHRCEVKTGATAEPKFLFPELGNVAAEASLELRRATAAKLFTTPDNARFSRTFVNRIWGRLFGRGIVAAYDDMDRRPFHPELLDWLAKDFVEHGHDIHHLLERIMTSRAYQAPAIAVAKAEEKFVFRGPWLRRISAEQFVDSLSAITGEWRVRPSNKAGPGVYSREWRLKSTTLTRALGRPIRDQVYTDRSREATTLQALELVNGDVAANLIQRGAGRLIGEVSDPPHNLFDSGVLNAAPAAVDIDVTGADKLWLLLENADSYDASRVVAGWANAELVGPAGAVALRELLPSAATREIRFKGSAEPAGAITGVLPSRLTVNLAGRGFTRLRATVGVDESCLRSDINPRVRFFVFRQEPDMQNLAGAAGDPPVARDTKKFSVERLYRYALGRAPSPVEAKIASGMAARGREGVEDLLWILALSPEFQYIR